MKESELRIGNIVTFKDYGLVAIHGISTINATSFVGTVREYKNIEPIHLTEDWLLKAGFEYIDNSEFFKHKSNHIVEYDYDKNKFIFYLVEYGDWFMSVEYVHQLQNIYFALTDEELTFNI